MSTPLDYIPRIRDYYQKLGYGTPYAWASFEDVPFCAPTKPLENMRIGIVTTAALYQADKGDQGPGAPYNGTAKFFEVYAVPIAPPPDLRISHIAYDRTHTSAKDPRSFSPLEALQSLGVTLSPRLYGLPTDRSVRKTTEIYCPDILKVAQEDDVDAALLIPNCPVCHQSTALAARHLEANGIPTVIMGCAKDIIERVGVPRLLASNFPLGNGAGQPFNETSQLDTARQALDLLASATGPRTTKISPQTWDGAPDWQKDYSNADLLSHEEIAQKRAEFDRVKKEANALK